MFNCFLQKTGSKLKYLEINNRKARVYFRRQLTKATPIRVCKTLPRKEWVYGSEHSQDSKQQRQFEILGISSNKMFYRTLAKGPRIHRCLGMDRKAPITQATQRPPPFTDTLNRMYIGVDESTLDITVDRTLALATEEPKRVRGRII